MSFGGVSESAVFVEEAVSHYWLEAFFVSFINGQTGKVQVLQHQIKFF